MAKKIFFLIALLGAINANALDAGLFSMDENVIEYEFEALHELEKYIETSGFISLVEVKATNPGILNQLNASSNFSPNQLNFGFDDMNWGAFACGFCCWPIGFFTILLNGNKDSDDRISYLIGAGISIIIGAISQPYQPVNLR
jgi:hypothetical protein